MHDTLSESRPKLKIKAQMIDNQSSDTLNNVRSLIESARTKEQQNDYSAALELANEAWQIVHLHRNKNEIQFVEADLLLLLAQIHLHRQDFAKLEEYIRPLLDLSRQLGDSEREAWALLNLGIVHSIRSDYKSAINLFLESLEKSEKLG